MSDKQTLFDAVADAILQINDGHKTAQAQAAIDTMNQHLGYTPEQVRELVEAMKSIAANTCCDNCQEAKLVAQKALRPFTSKGVV